MKIEVRLFATLREGRGKVLHLDIEEGFLASDVIEELGIKQEDVAIFLIGGRDAKLERVLIEGNVLSIFPPVGGG